MIRPCGGRDWEARRRWPLMRCRPSLNDCDLLFLQLGTKLDTTFWSGGLMSNAAPRNIVLLSDGTGNSAKAVFKTNVWRLFQLLDLRDPGRQIAFYDDGVGTSSFKLFAALGGIFGFLVADPWLVEWHHREWHTTNGTA